MIRRAVPALALLALWTAPLAVRAEDAATDGQVDPPLVDISSLPDVSGQLIMRKSFESEHVEDRPLLIWLPPSYNAGDERYPVVYLLDAEHMFVSEWAKPSRTEWRVDETMTELIAEGAIREAIIVGVPSNGAKRDREYLPKSAYKRPSLRSTQKTRTLGPVSRSLNDAHKAFLTEELKPYIDALARTRPGRDDTYVMGASFSGLAVIDLMISHPDTFGAAAALSPSLSIADEAVAKQFARTLPDPATHRLYIDRGTRGLDARYGRGFSIVSRAARETGYTDGDGFRADTVRGAYHTARDFRDRIDRPLRFLLAVPDEEGTDR
ncbi:MAG: alpha/beta hydrolase-fold protein [Litorimonas sp.]